LKESEIGDDDVVKVDFWIRPSVVEMRHLQTNGLIWNQRSVDQSIILVYAASKPTSKQTDAHDAEYEPEYETDEQHVQDGRDRLDQCIHNHLHCK